MEFHFKNGCLPQDEWNILNNARMDLQDSFYATAMEGFTDENGIDFYPIDLIILPDDIKKAVKIFNSFVKYLNFSWQIHFDMIYLYQQINGGIKNGYQYFNLK